MSRSGTPSAGISMEYPWFTSARECSLMPVHANAENENPLLGHAIARPRKWVSQSSKCRFEPDRGHSP